MQLFTFQNYVTMNILVTLHDSKQRNDHSTYILIIFNNIVIFYDSKQYNDDNDYNSS